MPTASIGPTAEKWSFLSSTVWRRWIVTISTVGLALALTEVLWLLVDRPVSAPLFLAAIVLTSWICGFRYGVIGAFLGGLTIDLFFVQPQYEFSASRDEIIRMLIFFSEGTLLSWLTARLRQAGEEIRTQHQKLRALTDYQQRLREDEQKRIARQVHDELGQALTGLKMHMYLLKGRTTTTDDSDYSLSIGLDELMQMTDDTIATVRRIASELRPSVLDDLGLVPAMEWQTQEFQRRTSISCEFKTNSEVIDFGPERNSSVYRIVQEALTNVARHANASIVTVELDANREGVNIIVRDNGQGFEKTPFDTMSLGIIGMQERTRMIGGELQVESSSTAGTALNLRIPLTSIDGEIDEQGLS